MWQAMKGLMGSKKFWMTVIGSAVVGGLSYLHAPADVVQLVAGLFGVGVMGQGMADWGKERPQ